MNVHHIGYLVQDIFKARTTLAHLGYVPISEISLDEYKNVWTCFLKKDELCIELVSSAGEMSAVEGLIKRFWNSPYHMCYESNDLEKDTKVLEGEGFYQIDQPNPVPALDNRKSCMFINNQIGMIELIENCAS